VYWYALVRAQARSSMARSTAVLLVTITVLATSPIQASSQEASPDTLTAQAVLERALSRSPRVLVADAHTQGARARLADAKVWVPENPVLEALVDPEVGGRSKLELTFPMEFGYRRHKRIGLAKAEVNREEHSHRDVARLAAAEALESYYRVLHARDRLVLAQEWRALSEELHRVAQERHRTGDVALLDLRLSETELARAIADSLFEGQALAGERGVLASVMNISNPRTFVVIGDLADRSILEPVLRDSLSGEREDVLAARSELAAAEAQLALARTEIIPDLAFRWDREHDDTGAVDAVGVELAIPLFARGQGSKGEARARIRRADIELKHRQTTAAAEILAAREAYGAAVAGVAALENEGLQAVRESEAMALEGYRAGKINLPTLLLLRRQLLEARRDAADRMLETALLGINLAQAMGTWP
ncbi:MAG TPA: TolC family protein, partial [Candidatus Eisenbacteria bacterium]|nr:TolC family protein [Candidatus Eisenbacteria bacterium]